MTYLTKEQRKAVHRVYQRGNDWHGETLPPYREYRRRVVQGFDCVMLPIPGANLWLGIETDGYTHS